MIRTAAPAVGLTVLAAVGLAVLAGWTRGSFLAHMTAHVAIVAIAAPLIALRIVVVRWRVGSPVHTVFAPVLASVFEFFVAWGWHAPALHAAARQSAAVLAVEQLSFLAAGLVLWTSCLAGLGDGARDRLAAGAFGLFLTSMHMTLLGVLLTLATRSLYAHGAHAGGVAPFGLTPLEDQQVGGVVMLAVAGTACLIGGIALVARLLGGAERRAPVD